jgi:hypothetical protein
VGCSRLQLVKNEVNTDVLKKSDPEGHEVPITADLTSLNTLKLQKAVKG